MTYAPSLADARWEASSSVFECRLSLDIAALGTASFNRRAGELEVFRLRQRQPLLAPGDTMVHTDLPGWRNESNPRLLARVSMADSTQGLQVGQAQVQVFQSQLDAGLRLILMQGATTPGRDPLRVVLEPLGFSDAFKNYQQCLTRLLPVNFGQVERTSIYFPVEGENPDARELRKLDHLIRYVKADSAITHIFIDGHTDSEGLRPENLEISRQRAELVAAYLQERGIPDTLLTTRWHGERYPVVSNNTPQGRAQNRRVTLRLERGS